LIEISTLLMTDSTSVRASHRGLPVSRAMQSVSSSDLPRTTLAKRRIVSTLTVTGRAAHSGQAALANWTSASTFPTGPRQ
jgi:hypothetical protein